jgi:hypothetical protein
MNHLEFCQSIKVKKQFSGTYCIEYKGEELDIVKDDFWWIGYCGDNESMADSINGWNRFETKREAVYHAKTHLFEYIYNS